MYAMKSPDGMAILMICIGRNLGHHFKMCYDILERFNNLYFIHFTLYVIDSFLWCDILQCEHYIWKFVAHYGDINFDHTVCYFQRATNAQQNFHVAHWGPFSQFAHVPS